MPIRVMTQVFILPNSISTYNTFTYQHISIPINSNSNSNQTSSSSHTQLHLTEVFKHNQLLVSLTCYPAQTTL